MHVIHGRHMKLTFKTKKLFNWNFHPLEIQNEQFSYLLLTINIYKQTEFRTVVVLMEADHL